MRCLVFDIGNNRHRLIARTVYRTHCVYVLGVMSHKEVRQEQVDRTVRLFRTAAKKEVIHGRNQIQVTPHSRQLF